MIRAHKIRLNPTAEQAAYFRRCCGIMRFCFNWGLAEIKKALDGGTKPLGWMGLKKQFNAIKGDQYPWVYEVTKCAAETGFENLGAAIGNFWQSKKGKRQGKSIRFPRFKSKKHGIGSFRIANDKFSVEEYWITIPKLGKVNMTEPLRFEGKCLNATISYRTGWWWVSIQVEMAPKPDLRPQHVVGVDVGIKNLAVMSDEQVFENQKYLKAALRMVKRWQRAVSRRIKGSRNRSKAQARLALAHYRVTCKRNEAIHTMTTSIARTATLIGVEDLNVAGMLKNHSLAQSLNDAGFAEIHRQLAYKSEWYGGRFVKIDRFYPSSKLHHSCGGYNPNLTLKDRMWRCPKCGDMVDRDLNAARNIRDESVRRNFV